MAAIGTVKTVRKRRKRMRERAFEAAKPFAVLNAWGQVVKVRYRCPHCGKALTEKDAPAYGDEAFSVSVVRCSRCRREYVC